MLKMKKTSCYFGRFNLDHLVSIDSKQKKGFALHNVQLGVIG
jgi:hypothetical protein